MKTLARVLSGVLGLVAGSLVLEAALEPNLSPEAVMFKALQAIILAFAAIIIWALGDD